MDKQTKELAAKLLKITLEEAVQFSHYIQDIDAYYFSVPVKGGSSIIIKNSEVLYANSSVSYDDHVRAFINGVRTPLEAFNAE